MLPVYSVADEIEAEMLLTSACPMTKNQPSHYIAEELVKEQTIDNLRAFGRRLDGVHERMRSNGLCRCSRELALHAGNEVESRFVVRRGDLA